MKHYSVAVVGAGPGDPDLLTVKAHRHIQNADVILHDNLVSDNIMIINSDAEKIYVGRKYGDTSNQWERQQKINQLLEHYYFEGKKVVRLKSGDPYIYGRAAEEARYLTEKTFLLRLCRGFRQPLQRLIFVIFLLQNVTDQMLC
ncbi:hypothetical protein FHK87_05490 [Aquimarina algicola]|uniref:uroporphyrinogen-III C-methyltransferase n=1 Tax=Aquimarina algicola TaxID=2589995 RepID=A0A504JF08_9FLAO|nr:hypothetical protein FHK87_05490 [Aquimarina algicola]